MKALGPYEILAEIAEGGMATVYAGRLREDPSRLVALKVIRSQHARDKAFVDMFVDEAKITARLSHPNIIAIRELGHEGEHYFLAMELVLGQTLAAIADAASARVMPLPFEAIAWIGARVAEGLHFAHEHGDRDVIHRDINPSNVIVTYDGNPKIIDFGLARAADRVTRTAHGIVKGKVAYMSPEQAHGRALDRRTDVFALGVTLWELSTGRRLFKADDDVATLRRVQACEVPDPSAIEGYPPELARILLRALAREPSERWPTAEAFAQALDAFVGARADARSVAAILAALFPPDRARLPWERAVESAFLGAARHDGILAWDDDAKKMTFLQLDGGTREAPQTDGAGLAELLERRARSTDATTASRAHLEMAIAAELAGDAARVTEHTKAALAKSPKMIAAHTIARRVKTSRSAPLEALPHLDAELEASSTEAARADLHGERARLLWAAHRPRPAIITEWERALGLRATDPAALAGLESAFAEGGAGDAPRLAEHLVKMIDAAANEPKLAAWLHVERARILDRLDDRSGCAAALQRALSLDPGLGPVRDACVRDAVVHRDFAALAALLDAEAQLEPDGSRAAALELDAACLARRVSKDLEGAERLLTRATARQAAPAVVVRIWDELVEVLEERQRWATARLAREHRLTLLPAATRSRELAAMGALAERAGDASTAISDLERSLGTEPTNARAFESLDRLLAADPDRREELWANRAARTSDPALRAATFVRAADLAGERGRIPQAIGYLRAAAAGAPDDVEVMGRLAGLLAGSPNEKTAADASARIAIYARAADLATDPAVRVAWLERIALLQEEVAADPAAAKATYVEIRRLDRDRRSALMGLQRAAARSGDLEAYAAALLDEAAMTSDAAAAKRARRRAAEVLARVDGERALRLLEEILRKDEGDDEAHALVVRLHEQANRWGEAVAARAARIAHTSDPIAKAELLVAQADAQRLHLGARDEALVSLRAARALGPARPGIAESIATLLGDDPRALRAWLVQMAESSNGEARAVLFARAAEFDELAIGDDAAAAAAYERALEALPDDPWLVSRRSAVEARMRRAAKATKKKSSRDAREPECFEDALELLADGAAEVALTAIEAAAARAPASIPALRALAAVARAGDAMPLLANALEQQVAALATDHARLVALWAEAALIAWRLPESDGWSVYERILERAPEDRTALDAVLRLALPRSSIDVPARAAAMRALGASLAHARDESTRLAVLLELATLLELEGDRAAALARYREAMRIDARSPTAVLGAWRLGEALRDTDAVVDAACARADLADDGPSRAAFLLRAAGPLASRRDPESRARAATTLERALEADASSVPAAAMLIALLQQTEPDRLIAALRDALGRASRTDAIVMLGMELAQIARARPTDLPIAISALEKVREAAPRHVPALLALGDAYAAQSDWPKAVGAYEAAAEHGGDARTKKRALLALVDAYDHASNAADALRVLRAATDADPRDAKTIRALIQRLRSAPATDGAPAEIARRLEQLAAAESTPEAKTAAYLELFDAASALGERSRAERALVLAVAESPTPANLARLATVCSTPPGGPTEHAAALALVVARGAEIGRPSGLAYGALAVLEIDALGRIAEGVAHAKTAIGLTPNVHEARGALVRGLARLGQHPEAIATAAPMFEHGAQSMLALARPDVLLDSLEGSFQAANREQEAIVVRELRTIGGVGGDAAAVNLRARRLPTDIHGGPPAIDRTTLWQRVVPGRSHSVLLEIAAAIAGATAATFPSELEASGVRLRGNVPAGHPLAAPFARAVASLGQTGTELLVSDAVVYPVAVHGSHAVVVAPWGLGNAPEPVQVAALARPLVRIALGMPWIDRARPEDVRALLVTAARVVCPSYASEQNDGALESLVADFTKPLARAIGRAHKKALSALEPRLDGVRGPTLDDVRDLMLRVGQSELRVAFLLTGDLLATLDDLRASDGEYARAAGTPGAAALSATLRHPLAGDTVAFALTETATAIRREAGTIWTASAESLAT